MANVDAPFGLRPVNTDGSGQFTGAVRKYHVASSDGTALFIGDPVIITGESNRNLVDDVVYPTVARATSGSSAYTTGVVVGVEPVTDESLVYRAASTERYVWVADDPEQLFEVQADEDIATGDIGNTVDFIFDTAGSTATGLSGCELDSSNIGTGDQLVIEGVRQAPNRNETGSNFTVALVRINLHQKRNTTGV